MSESVVISKGTDVVNVSISGQGEVNTGQNVGTGAEVFKEKVGADFRYRTIIGGTGITATQNADDITLDVDPASHYNDSDVDAHLNTSTATASQVLTWDGADYDWVTAAAAGIQLTDLSVTQNPAGAAALTYDNTSGVFTYTPTDTSTFVELTDFSVTTDAASNGGSLSYDNTTGTFTFAPADLEAASVASAINVVYTAVNKDTVTLAKGTPVYAKAGTSSGQTVEVGAADASDPAKMPAIGVLGEQIAVDGEGDLLIFGHIQGVDTQTPNFNVGDVIYVAVGGGYTNSAPTGEGNIIQNLGVVTKRHLTNGGGLIEGSGRGAATPNLDDGKIFIGNGSNQSSTATLDTSIVPENSNLYYTNARVSSHLLSMDGSIIPDTDITYDLGSPTKQWRDVYIGPGSLYVNGKKVIEDDAGTITVETDADQNLRVRTTGTGVTQVTSASAIQLTATNSADIELTTATGQIEMNGDVVIDVTKELTTSTGGALTVNAALNLGSNSLTANDVTVNGNLTVSGTTTTVNTEELLVADNTVVLNSNYAGSTPSENAGIEINRGTQSNKTLLWDESNDKWTVGAETFVAGTVEAALTGNVTGTVSDISNHTTSNLTEGSNLYYTDARANSAIDARVTKTFVEDLNIDVDGGTY